MAASHSLTESSGAGSSPGERLTRIGQAGAYGGLSDTVKCMRMARIGRGLDSIGARDNDAIGQLNTRKTMDLVFGEQTVLKVLSKLSPRNNKESASAAAAYPGKS